ncbi:GDP-fucose protein O-fucosyltransferase 2 isoform X1 [Diorhabda sublineata]|uniref:GDP-fucose protein O-fucosyltransferase 2 isoform X1 n=1 Tax=Diorhabda sublineata TaxID=1163346 RepID=UPI0024E0CD31|nr:GDP-fucose protein O-fucosyltransferase 2 isoform X1 [Diorhabda sublineata]
MFNAGCNFYLIMVLNLLLPSVNLLEYENVCFKNEDSCKETTRRYLLYDVNRPEGFNLRRDVYMRLAVLFQNLQTSPDLNNFVLVLPPWSNLVHWSYSDIPEQIPWGYYFDLDSLKLFAPVIEMHEFFHSYPYKFSKITIDEVYNLQHFENMFETGDFRDRMEISPCRNKNDNNYFFYKNVSSANVKCLSYHGPATKLIELLRNTTAKTILINHAEVVLHDTFGNAKYWQARRSMRFNTDLKRISAEFRRNYLNSDDVNDKIVLPETWIKEKPRRDAIGGPYVAVHLRRRDFVRSRPTEVPGLQNAAVQIKTVLKNLGLSTVFVATDGTEAEFGELERLMGGYKVMRFVPPLDFMEKYKDGGAAIVDQIICSCARYFVGTHESTFTFRIQEEREIMGFPVDSTFNVFCSESGCPTPSVWKIVF